MQPIILRLATLSVLVALLNACASSPTRPDLARLYAHQSDQSQAVPVVLIHGVMGGRLVNEKDENEIWPGSLRRLLFDDYSHLRLDITNPNAIPIESDKYVRGITDRVAGSDFYGQVIRVLQEAGGYMLTSVGTPAVGTSAISHKRRLYVFAYDWRQDNLNSVRQLDQFLTAIRDDHQDPNLKVDVIAHSMGGLITRYFARYGTQDVLNDNDFPVNNYGAMYLRRVVLLGTPNFGSVLAADLLNKGMKVVFDTIEPEIIATFPSAYQVLPHALNNWLLSTSGEVLSTDIFDVAFWQDNRLSIFYPRVRNRIIASRAAQGDGEEYFQQFSTFFEHNLERARRFTWSLTVPIEEVAIRYSVFGGDCSLTPARMVYEQIGGAGFLRLKPSDVKNKNPEVDYSLLMLEPGDGTVSKASLLARQSVDPTVARHRYSFFPLGSAFFLCEDHQKLTGNINFQDNLLNVLLSADPL